MKNRFDKGIIMTDKKEQKAFEPEVIGSPVRNVLDNSYELEFEQGKFLVSLHKGQLAVSGILSREVHCAITDTAKNETLNLNASMRWETCDPSSIAVRDIWCFENDHINKNDLKNVFKTFVADPLSQKAEGQKFNLYYLFLEMNENLQTLAAEQNKTYKKFYAQDGMLNRLLNISKVNGEG